MNLLEYQGKKLLVQYGIDIPDSVLIRKDDSISTVPFGFPVFLKAQVPTGGRGKAGGVIRVDSMANLGAEVHRIGGLTIKGFPVTSILIEGMVHGVREIYVSISIDGSLGAPVLLVGKQGGVDIEATPEGSRKKFELDIMEDISADTIRAAADFLDVPDVVRQGFAFVITSAWKAFRERDLELLEINPLALTDDSRFVAVDAKVVFNEDSSFRNPDIAMEENLGLTQWERRCRSAGFAGVQLSGSIGVIANGAGLTMASLDAVFDLGMTGGAFLDLGGSDDPEKIAKAVGLMFEGVEELGLDGILINVFGGITRCDTVAEGILRIPRITSRVPIVVRMRGVNEDIGRSMLTDSGIPAYLDTEEACHRLREVV